jgi:GntR family transcriptional regulator
MLVELRVDRDSPLPLGAQLEARLHAAIAAGELAPGAQLPSLRHVAAEAGVNVNTVRAVYTRLEAAGTVSTEQGRGTFVAQPSGRPQLRAQIERLEAELVRLPPPRTASTPQRPTAQTGAGLLSTADLAAIRDDLLERLRALDTARAEVIERLELLERTEEPALATHAQRRSVAARRSSATHTGAQVRWVGA